MEFLAAAVLCSVAVSVFLKISRSRGVVLEQAVAVNYAVAVACTLFFLKPQWGQAAFYAQHWPLFAALGILLPAVFILLGRAVETAGMVRADAAQRLSLFLPVAAAFLIFGEKQTPAKIIGLILAFMALPALLYKHGKRPHARGRKKTAGMPAALLLAGVWAGFGAIDILFKQVAKSGQAFSGTLLATFVLAGVVMFVFVTVKRSAWTLPSVVGGMVLGCLNFANIYFYLYAHKIFRDDPALVFTGMNLGVIVLATVTGLILFKEKLNQANAAGLVLAAAAIVVLFYGNLLQPFLGR